jgi:hypothetical protein
MTHFTKLALGVAALLAVSSTAQAATQLGFAIDGSGSISPAAFSLQLQGLSSAIGNLVPTNSSVEITVVQFAGFGAVVEVGPTLIDSPATLTTVTNQILAITQNFGGTPMAAGINLLTSAVAASPEFADPNSEQLFNVSTDGQPNNASATTAAAAAAQAAGIDGLSAEAVGQFANPTFLASIVFPGVSPGPIITLPNPIPDPRTQGFVISVAGFQDFEAAIATKIRAILACTIDPLLDFNLLGDSHTVTLTVESGGQPAPGRDMNISVDSGPNSGTSSGGTSDANGEFALTYQGAGGPGVDTISGQCEDDQGVLQPAAGTAKKFWDEDCQPNGIPDTCDIDCNGFNGECDAFDDCGMSADDDGNGIPDECLVLVPLDIKPGSCPNSYNRRNNGVLPVALVGTEDFDVTQIDLATLLISRADGEGGSLAPLDGPPGPGTEFEDVATPFDGELCDCHEAQGDGILDLSLKFKTVDLVAALDLDEFDPEDTPELVVSGSLLDGTEIAGADCVRLVPAGNPPNMLAVKGPRDSWIDITPLDDQLDGGGFGASFERTYPQDTDAVLTAPSEYRGRAFLGWKGDDGRLIPSQSVMFRVNGHIQNLEAVYDGLNRRCGLGYELALLLPPLVWLVRRRRLAKA